MDKVKRIVLFPVFIILIVFSFLVENIVDIIKGCIYLLALTFICAVLLSLIHIFYDACMIIFRFIWGVL